MKRRLLIVIAFVLLGVGQRLYGQSSGTYNVMQNGTTLTLTTLSKTTTGACNTSGSDTYIYYYGPSASSTVYGTASTSLAFGTYSPSLTTVGSQSFIYVKDQLHKNWSGAAGDCLGGTHSYTNLGSFTVNVIADISATATLSSTMCSAASGVNLYSYVNLGSGVTFYVDGSAIVGSTFTPSSYTSNASHTVTASYTYDNNGTRTVSLGTVLIIPSSLGISDPNNYSTCPNGNASFTASTSGSNLSYQWYEYGSGGTWNAIGNGGVYSGATSSTLTLTGVGSGFSGYQYRNVASNGCTSATSNAATLTIYGQVSINSSPSNSSVCQQSGTTFSVSASGGNGSLSYQWQESTNGGVSYGNLSNGTYSTETISGATTATLSVTNAKIGANGYRYRCVVNDGCGTSNQNISSAGTLTVYSSPSISAQPTNASYCLNGNSSFTVAASAGNGSLSYQWQYSSDGGISWNNLTNTGIYTGATTATLSLTTITATYSGYRYRVYIQDACGSVTGVTSSSATLSQYANVSITSHPSSSSICRSSNTSFSVTATAGNGSLSYQWAESTDGGTTYNNVSNGGVYSGATTATLSITGATAGMTGYKYRVLVQDGCGSVSQSTSNVATLTVYAAPTINTNPSNASYCLNGNSSFTVAATAGNGSLSYQWQVSTDAGTTWNNVSNTGIYTNATTATLSLTTITAAYSGYRYRANVQDACGSATQVTSSSATLSQYANVSINTHPSNSSICPGANTTYTVAATVSNGSASYQWALSTDGGTTYNNVSNGGVYSGATTATLSITGATLSMNSYRYRATVQDGCGSVSQAVSNAGTLTVFAAPTINTQPVNASYCLNGNSSFTVAATAGNGSLSYQWQVSTDGGTSWNSLSNAGVYNGTTTTTLSLTSIPASYNTYKYRVLVQDACGSSNQTTSNQVTLSQYANVSINTQPSNSSVCPGANTSYTVAATSGNGSLSYQWALSTDGGTTYNNVSNGGVYSGATTATLSITGATLSMNSYRYRVTVQDACGSVSQAVANAVTLTVYVPPVINTQPVSTNYCPGSNVNLSVAGTTSPGTMNYVWKLSVDGGATWNTITNIAPYSGATSATLSITGATAGMTGYKYQVVVSDATCSSNSTTSNTATITAYANVSTTNPVSSGICPGGTVSFATTATPSNSTAVYQWQVSTNNGSTFANVTNGGVYSGATTNTLTLTGPNSSYHNNQYRVTVQDGCGSVTQTTSAAATLTIYTGAAITTQPISSTICLGSNTAFSVSASKSTGSLAYQWWVNPGTGTFVTVGSTAVYSGATTATLTLTSPPASYAGYQYYLVVTDGCTGLPVTSNTVLLNFFGMLPVTTAPSAQTTCPNSAASFSVVATANTGSLSYQWAVSTDGGTIYNNVSNGGVYSGATMATLNISSATIGMNGYYYRVVVNDGCNSTSTRYTSPGVMLTVNNSVTISTDLLPTTTPCVNGSMTLSVTASGTGLTYQWQENSGTGWNNLVNIGIYSGVFTNTLTISSMPASYNGFKYRLQINGTCSSTTSSETTVSIITPPSITADPVAKIVCAATSTSFSVTASGTSPSYQWQYSATGGAGTFSDISGATSATYSIASAAAADAGYYRARVYNGCGTINSNAAQLTVNPVTSISVQPADFAVCPLGTNSFSVTAAGTSPFTYTWKLSTDGGSNFTTITNTGIYTGATTATLTLTSIPTSYSGYKYQVIVSGSCGSAVTSSTALLTVNPTPAKPTVPEPAICGPGQIGTTASSPAPAPTYNWYLNSSDVTPTYTGATYTITSLSTTTTYYATVVSFGCESSKQSVVYTINTPTSVGLGAPLTLCIAQGKYDLSQDIVQTNAKDGTFSWKDANNVTYSGNLFDPQIGDGTYTVTYTPPSNVQTPPNCYIVSQRTVKVISSSGSNGITFLAPDGNPVVNAGNYINMCAGNPTINLSTYASPTAGSWTTKQGSGISGNGSNVIFTASVNNITSPSVPNIFTYTVQIGGCTNSADLSIYVSNNTYTPSVTGVPSVVCPQTNLNIGASVSAAGSFTFNWYNAANALVGTGSTFPYKVLKDTTLSVRSVNEVFGCLSPASPISIVTPFTNAAISVDKSTINYAEKVSFAYTGATSGLQYKWTFGDGWQSIEQNPTHYYYESGTYTIDLLLTSSLNCSKTIHYSPVTVVGPDVDIITGVEPEAGKSMSVYPLPVRDLLNIKSESDLKEVAVFNLHGVGMISQKCSGRETTVSVADLAAGVYLLSVQDSDGVKRIKIVKE
jgi:hypothetical protein